MLRHRVLLQEDAIHKRVAELATVVANDLPSSEPMLIGLLTGSFVFLADLMRALARLGIAPRVDFVTVSHYGLTTKATGTASMLRNTEVDVRDRAVLIVDDIVDTGVSLRLVRDQFAARGARWLKTCVLLDKPARRTVDVTADYVGFEVPDVWLIGYGLDAGGEGRALPYIAALEEPLLR